MKVTLRLSTELLYSITIPDNSTVEDLRNSAKVGCPPEMKLPEDFKLIYNGEKLSPHYRTLESFGMQPNKGDNTVILMSSGVDIPAVGGATSFEGVKQTRAATVSKTKKKSRCSFKTCSSAPLRMVGSCSHCHGSFCAKHRLLEDHVCSGLQFCKDDAHERNAMKLQSESTITSEV